MSIRKDEQFEQYLKQFRPLEAEPMRIKNARHTQHRFVTAAWAMAIAAVLAVAVLAIHTGPEHVRSAHHVEALSDVERPANPEPLTVHSTNAFLARAPSLDEVVGQVIVQSQPVPIPEGEHSALNVLGKEDPELCRLRVYASFHL